METVYMLVNNQAWNGPIVGKFTPGKKWMLIFLSGSAWSHAGGTIGVELHLNGVPILQSTTFTNEAGSHKVSHLLTWHYQSTYEEEVNFAIVPLGNTVIDFNDRFNLTVTVFQ